MYISFAIVRIFMYMFHLVSRLRAPASLQGGIIKGISGNKTAHSSGSFVRLFASLYSSFTPSCVFKNSSLNQPGPTKHHRSLHISELPRVPVTRYTESLGNSRAPGAAERRTKYASCIYDETSNIRILLPNFC